MSAYVEYRIQTFMTKQPHVLGPDPLVDLTSRDPLPIVKIMLDAILDDMTGHIVIDKIES